MDFKEIKKLLKEDAKLLDHAHYMEMIRLREKEYNYAEHYRILGLAEKEIESYENRGIRK